MHRFPMRASLLLFLLVLAPAMAAQVHIRLVDAITGTPLEYWDKNIDQPALKSTLYWRMPRTVYVDGQPWAYAKYGRQDADLMTKDDQGGKAMDDLEKELGTAGPQDAEVRSDRATDIQSGSGLKALASGDLADGEHTLQPGTLRFKIQKGELAETAGPLSKAGPGAVRLACHPIDFSLASTLRPGSPIEVVCTSGALAVFRDVLVTGDALALRLYLPASDASYTLKAAGCGEFNFTVNDAGVRLQGQPALAEGLLATSDRFAITVTTKSASPKPAARTSPAGEPELYVFTDRNRAVFAEGEAVQVSVRAWGAAQGDDKVVLILDQDGAAQELTPQPLVRSGGSAAAEIEIDTRMLRPGAYRLRAKWGATESNPVDIQIAGIMPETNMKLFGYTKWNKFSYDPGALAVLPRAGLNLVVGEGVGSPFGDWGAERRPADTSRVAALQKGHCPPELLESPPENDAGADYLLAHGVENVPIACGLILYFNVGEYWKNHADDRNQRIQFLGQEWRRYPNFRGIVHCTGDGPTPATLGMVWAAGAGSFDIIHDERVQKLREAFDFKVGKIKIDDATAKAAFEKVNSQMQGAIGFGVGMDAGLKLEGDDTTKVEWARWLNDLYPDCFREERKALSPLVDSPVVNCSHSWGTGAGSGMWEETFYRDQDNPVIDIHGDYGIMPMSYSSGSDTLCMGQQRRPWIALDLLPERPLANGMKILLEGLSRNPAGVGGLNATAGCWSLQKEPSERMTTIMNLARRFGDEFLTLQRRDEIAILASMRQDAVAGQSEASIWGAHFLATKAGYQANVITEEQRLREPATLKRFRAVFLVNMTAALPVPLQDQLKRFQADGGVLIDDHATKTELPGMIGVSLTNMVFANQVDFRDAYGRYVPLIKPFQDAVGPKLTPFFESSARHVHLVRSVDEDLEYWTLFNDTLLGPDENPNGHFIQFLYKGVEADLKARRTGVLYDAFRRKPVDAKQQGDALAWHADMRYLPGTVYLCADRPIASLSVNAPRRTARGSAVRFKASALDAQGKVFAGKLPVEVVVSDPAGNVRYRVYRTTNHDVLLKIAGNDPAGRWTWAVTDQATGLAANGEFTVEGDAVKPAVQAAQNLVYDGWAVGQSLRSRAFDILLYPDQMALKETADALAAELQKAGAKAAVRILGAADQRQYPMNWKLYTVEDEEMQRTMFAGDATGLRVKGKNQFGDYKSDPMKHAFYGQYAASAERVLYRDVILLGRGDVADNPLLDLIARRTRMLPRNPSPSFPAPGFGFVAYAWAPFHYGHDAIVVYGQDAAGLSRATTSLVQLAKDPPHRPASAWHQPEEYGQSYTNLGLRAAADEAAVAGNTRTSESLLPDGYDQRIVAARADAGRLAIRQEPTANPKGPVFATVDLKTGTARQVNSDSHAFRAATLDALARSDTNRLAAPLILRSGPGRILPLDRGLAMLDEKDAVAWFFDPFPASAKLDESQYPRLCHKLTVSADGRTVAAGFYDLGAGGNYGPKYRQFNAAAVVLVNAQTGQEISRCPGYLASQLAIADDGSRCFIIDNADFEQGRGRWNRHGGPTFAVFDRKGEEIFYMPGDAASTLAVSGSGKLAVLAYDDTRRYVSVVDVDRKLEHRVEYARIDRGIAAAPDGSFAVITYADGLVRKVAADGKTAWEQKLPAPGVPAVGVDGTILVCADDGRAYLPEGKKEPFVFGTAPVETVSPKLDEPPAGLAPPAAPFWTTLAGDFKPEALPLPANPDLGDVKGAKSVTLDVPQKDPLDTVLFAFRYRLRDPGDKLTVAMTVGGAKVSFIYPYLSQPRTVAVPLRTKQAGPITLTFSSVSGASVDQPQLLRLRLGNHSNAALAGVGMMGANPNTPRLMIPNVHGALGDPRVEQVAYGFPSGKFTLPPDVTGAPKADVFTCFDGNVYAGSPLYPTVFPGYASWDPPESRPTLRSAQVVIEYAKPRTIAAVGIWEHPNDRPVAAFALEYATQTSIGGYKELNGDWALATDGRNNVDYYHMHVFPKPISARFWRYTVLETPCPVQRVAEIELYESAMDSIEQDIGQPQENDAVGLPQ